MMAEAPEAPTGRPERAARPTRDRASLRQALAGVDLPGECCALWMKHAPRLLPDDLRTAWGETVARLEKVGKMHRGGVWLRKAIAEECERRNVTVPLPPDDPPTGTDGPARPGAANDTSATSTPVAHGATPASAPQALDVVDAPDARSDGGDGLSTRAARRKHLGTKHHERAVVASYAAHCGLPHYLDDCTARLTEIVAPDGTRLSELTARKRLVRAASQRAELVVTLDGNVRQRDPAERRALAELRAGSVPKAVAWYARNDRVQVQSSRVDTLVAMTDEVDHGLAESLVAHAGHRDQKLSFERVHRISPGHDPTPALRGIKMAVTKR